jgi:hypothetical protein
MYGIAGLTLEDFSQVLVLWRDGLSSRLATHNWEAITRPWRASIMERLPHGVVHVLVGEITHADSSATHPYFHERLAMVEPDVVVVLRLAYAQLVVYTVER